LGIFALFLAGFLLLGFDGIYSAVIAGVLALAISLVFLQKQRDALSAEIYRRNARDKFSGVPDQDADVENAILDSNEDNR
jgi:predicted Co/Zn/Cd cation transporter (cation efflux family)